MHIVMYNIQCTNHYNIRAVKRWLGASAPE